MTTTVQSKSADETPIPKLTAIVLLAAMARDNGLDWPDGVKFVRPYSHLNLDFDAVADLTAWVRALGGPRIRTVRSDPYVHHTSSTPLRWNGWSLYVKCLVPVDLEIDDATSATLDELVAAVSA